MRRLPVDDSTHFSTPAQYLLWAAMATVVDVFTGQEKHAEASQLFDEGELLLLLQRARGGEMSRDNVKEWLQSFAFLR